MRENGAGGIVEDVDREYRAERNRGERVSRRRSGKRLRWGRHEGVRCR